MRFFRSIIMLALLVVGLASCLTIPAYNTKPAEPFTVVLIPDTQYYSEKHPLTYLQQTTWIKDYKDAINIKFAIHLGDIVQTAKNENEWVVADTAHKVLDGVVPYSVVPGNHDLHYHDDVLTRGTPLYHKYFPPSRFENEPWYGGHMGEDNACNYTFFEEVGLKFMVLSFAFAPSDEMIAWASDIVRQHPEHRVIVATHYYMRTNGRGNDGHTYGLNGADGEMLWNKFVRSHENIFMVVSGHVLGAHHQVSMNDAGKPVIEILSDYQGEANGGDGWLQMLRFMPDENRIDVVAYTPKLDKYNDKPQHTYSLKYAMKGE